RRRHPALRCRHLGIIDTEVEGGAIADIGVLARFEHRRPTATQPSFDAWSDLRGLETTRLDVSGTGVRWRWNLRASCHGCMSPLRGWVTWIAGTGQGHPDAASARRRSHCPGWIHRSLSPPALECRK